MADELADRGTPPTEVDAQTTIGSPRRKNYTPAPIATASGQHYGSGATVQLVHQKEAEFYAHARDKYLSENSFTVASDISALDRLLLFEVQVQRWQMQLASGLDYDLNDLDAVDESTMRRSLKDTSTLISQIQNDLGLTMAQRLKSQNAESVGAYLDNLRLRAKEHGVHRDVMVGKAMELLNEVFAVAGSFDRSNDNERMKLGFDGPDDVIQWILQVAKPQYDEIDQHYRNTNQKLWIRTL